MAYLKFRHSSAFGFATSCARRFSGFAIKADSEEVPDCEYWKLKVETERAEKMTERKAKMAERAGKMHWISRFEADKREYLASLKDTRLEILEFKYQLKARGIPELFIGSLTRDALLHCHNKSQDEHLLQKDQAFCDNFISYWFPRAREHIWRIILEMPTMIDFKEDMQKVLSSEDLDLLVMKATTFHRELNHFHHSGVRGEDTVTFVREHFRKDIDDLTVDPVHLEGFMQAMAKKINLNVIFVDEKEVSECAGE